MNKRLAQFKLVVMGAFLILPTTGVNWAVAQLGKNTSIVASKQIELASGSIDSKRVKWAGSGKYRLLVEVPPQDLGDRASDEMPAEIIVELSTRLKEANIGGKANIASIQVIQFDPATGEPLAFDDYEYARSPFDRPFRWYDNAIPYNFPEVWGTITPEKGELKRTISPRAGAMYTAIGDWDGGHLAWVHTQEGNQPSWYGIYFNVLPAGRNPQEAPPRGWVGDGSVRAERWGNSTTGAGHTLIALDDWNEDGLVDIIFGEQYGQLSIFPNVGTREQPAFPYTKLLFDAEGLPIDLGVHAAPLIVDWDSDGVKDLLVGTYVNRTVFYKNEGTNLNRKLVYKGLVRTDDGKPLEIPHLPAPYSPKGLHKRDYYPVLDAVDWNGDGRLDLLAGGYVTGRIFYYENISPSKTGEPVLTFRGPLEMDGKPFDVGGMCASPCVADFNSDGKLDLIGGSLPRLPDGSAGTINIRYYENIGTRTKPTLAERPFPKVEGTIASGMDTPRAADWNGDGLLDLIISANQNIYLVENIGTATEPKFKQHSLLKVAWGRANITTHFNGQFTDWNGDGLIDLIRGYSVYLNSGRGSPYFFDKRTEVFSRKYDIAHRYTYQGRDRTVDWSRLYDFDQDGKIDIMVADWAGYIWLHRNLSTAEEENVDTEGYKLPLINGGFVQVGPQVTGADTMFRAAGGSRAVFTVADFDKDGLDDLVVGDTYGYVLYFRNVGPKEKPRFDLPVKVGDLHTRLLVDATDWDVDGRKDIIAGTSGGTVRVFLNTGSKGSASFDEGFDPELPQMKQPRILMVDLNGDGDEDLFVPSIQGSCLVERSFLKYGYAQGEVTAFQKR